MPSASMRPRQPASENVPSPSSRSAIIAASMRPRQPASENCLKEGSHFPAILASMRPRQPASENYLSPAPLSSLSASFNEAEATCLGKCPSRKLECSYLLCFNEAEATCLGKFVGVETLYRRVIASMRPRQPASENFRVPQNGLTPSRRFNEAEATCLGKYGKQVRQDSYLLGASMRPRQPASENFAPGPVRQVMLYASMRPRQPASENFLKEVVKSFPLPGFNEAEATCLGKYSLPSK